MTYTARRRSESEAAAQSAAARVLKRKRLSLTINYKSVSTVSCIRVGKKASISTLRSARSAAPVAHRHGVSGVGGSNLSCDQNSLKTSLSGLVFLLLQLKVSDAQDVILHGDFA